MATDIVFYKTAHLEVETIPTKDRFNNGYALAIRVTDRDGNVTDMEVRGATIEAVTPKPFEEG